MLRWLEHFPADQVPVVRSEDFFSSTDSVFQEILTFLDLPPFQPADFRNYSLRPPTSAAAVENATVAPPDLDPSLRNRLREVFERHCIGLGQLLNRDFGWQ